MVYTLRFFSSKCSLFHNSNVFGFCTIHILYIRCAKIKKNNSGTKMLITHMDILSFTVFDAEDHSSSTPKVIPIQPWRKP